MYQIILLFIMKNLDYCHYFSFYCTYILKYRDVSLNERMHIMNIVLGIFLIAHAGVHLLYAGQSFRLFELQAGLTFPDGAWAFKRLGDANTRRIATVGLVLIALGFMAGGLGLLTQSDWGRGVVIFVSIASIILFGLLWDGKPTKLPEKGAIGILIDIAILVAVLVGMTNS